MKINKGVVRNPPPTPKTPETKPTKKPSRNICSTETLISAMGKYINKKKLRLFSSENALDNLI